MTDEDARTYRDLTQAERRVSPYFRTEEPLSPQNYEARMLALPSWAWDRFYSDFLLQERVRFSAECATVNWQACSGKIPDAKQTADSQHFQQVQVAETKGLKRSFPDTFLQKS